MDLPRRRSLSVNLSPGFSQGPLGKVLGAFNLSMRSRIYFFVRRRGRPLVDQNQLVGIVLDINAVLDRNAESFRAIVQLLHFRRQVLVQRGIKSAPPSSSDMLL